MVAAMSHPDFVGRAEDLGDGEMTEEFLVPSGNTKGRKDLFVHRVPRSQGAKDEGADGGVEGATLEVLKKRLIVLSFAEMRLNKRVWSVLEGTCHIYNGDDSFTIINCNNVRPVGYSVNNPCFLTMSCKGC